MTCTWPLDTMAIVWKSMHGHGDSQIKSLVCSQNLLTLSFSYIMYPGLLLNFGSCLKVGTSSFITS